MVPLDDLPEVLVLVIVPVAREVLPRKNGITDVWHAWTISKRSIEAADKCHQGGG
jgi:hypothetical protein